jgi:hypothetical protein
MAHWRAHKNKADSAHQINHHLVSALYNVLVVGVFCHSVG